MRAAWIFVVASCGNAASPPSATSSSTTSSSVPGAPTPTGAVTCDAAVPDRACESKVGLRVCKPGDKDRVGEWRFAIEAPPYTPTENITAADLTALWKHTGKTTITASADTIEALTALLGPGAAIPSGDRIEVTADQWAIVPADELLPNWKVVGIDGKHPLDKAPDSLAVPLCGSQGSGKLAIHNIDTDKLTVLVMTGTTALTRYTAKLMEEKGILYPLSAGEPWLAAADFVHISNEVSFIPNCDTGTGKPTMAFCSKEPYIELLEKSHANIIELTGNHLHDYGHEKLAHTIEMYEKRGWAFFGGGRNQLEATSPRLIEHHGNKLAFIGCNMPHTGWKVIRAEAPDVGACDIPRIQWQIRDLKSRGYTPIVSIQHDEVYKHDPPDGLVRDLRAVADAGPAFVMGSQAHCPHPWEVHRGTYVHYGPGNFYFDQFWHPVRDAAQDKLYIHAGKLLTVGHLYTRIEERGRSRILDLKERGELLSDLAGAQSRLPKGAEPWGKPIDAPAHADRELPDSVLVKGVLQQFTVHRPAKLEADKKYPLVIELAGQTGTDDEFVVTPTHTSAPADKLGPAISAWMTAKYAVDPARVTIDTGSTGKTAKPKKK